MHQDAGNESDRAQVEFATRGAHLEKLRSLFQSERLSPFMGLLTVTVMALMKATARSDVSIVFPANGNLLTTHVDIAAGASLRDVLVRVRRDVLDADPYKRSLGRLRSIYFDLKVESSGTERHTLPELVQPSPIGEAAGSFDCAVLASVAPSTVLWRIAYSTTIFDACTIEQVAKDIGLLSERLALRPDAPAEVTAAVPPQRPTRDEVLAGLYGEILGVDPVGIKENFFLLGGNSLLAIKLVNTVRNRLGVELPLRAVFEAPRPIELAQRLEAGLPLRVPLTRRPRET